MTSAAEAPGKYEFAPLGPINYGEGTSPNTLALSYPVLGPSRHVRAYFCMPYYRPNFLCSDSFCHETFRPLFCRLAPFPLVLRCSSRRLVGVDTESSEVVQETPHSFFFLVPHVARIGSNIQHTRAESMGLTHGRLPLLPLSATETDSAAAVCLLFLPLALRVGSVGLAATASSTPSEALLIDQVARAASRWY